MESSILNLFRHVEHPATFAAGDTIFEEGTPGRLMYVVLRGSVEIRVGNRVLDIAGPGDIIGEMALIDASARSATAVALEDCSLAPVDERQFLQMVERTPFFALNVMQVLADRLRRMDAGV